VTTEHVRRVPPAELGPMLRAARVRAGLGLREAAREVGISHGHVRGIEAGRYCPSVAVAEVLADVLGLDDAARALLMSCAVPEVGYSKPGRVRVLSPREH
jgi:DNA-binding XRE family transcriptional regulator